MITVKRIDHICLYVTSLSNSQTYYETMFGFACHLRRTDPSMLIVESEAVHFFMTEIDAYEEQSALTRQHISFQVEDLDTVLKLLDNAGENYETGVVGCFSHDNYKWVEWRDPDGIRLECVELMD